MKKLSTLSFLLFCFSGFLHAQITSSAINGIVSEETGTLPGATIKVIHLPTGTFNGAVSLDDGSYAFLNLQPGGPYRIECSYVGYTNVVVDNVFLTLGKNERINLKLRQNQQQLGQVEVSYTKTDRFNNDNTGIGTQIGKEQIEKLPSLNRSLQDMTRLSPTGSSNSFGGNSYRNNHLSIDGVANNDAFGFQEPASGAGGSVASGTPGGLARSQPISLDAIQEVQVALAPYDVKLGNFTGANINAVTRSGTNTLEGSVYSFGRNQRVAGKSVDEARTRLENYYDYQLGFRLGGALIQNKLFAFVNYEKSVTSEPVTFSPGTGGSNFSVEVAQAIKDTLKNRFGFDPGTYSGENRNRKNDKLFTRLDYYPAPGHQLTLRQNVVLAQADNLERTANILRYSSQAFVHHSNTYSTAFEWKASFRNNITNSLVLGYTLQKDKRTFDGTPTPHVDITYNTSNIIYLGTYREASIYGLDLKTYEITDNLSFYRGKHTFTIGTHNELYHIDYRFLSAWNGRWEYRSLQDFYDNKPNRIRGVYNNGDNSFENNQQNPSASFRVFLLSGYLQDEIRVSERLSVSAGVRLDMQVLPDKIPNNSKISENPAFSNYNNEYGSIPQVNPRIGFNYALDEQRRMQVRGGTGLFTGRVPFSNYAYSHYNDGLKYSNVDIRPTGTEPLVLDVQKLKGLQSGLTEVNLVDKNFKLPRSWRSSLAYDVKLPKDWVVSVEGVYSKTVTDVNYYSVNLKESKIGNLKGADNRPYYTASGNSLKIDTSFTNVFVLGNTNQGFKYNVSLLISKTFKYGLSMSHSYSYGRSKDLVNGVRVSPAANWEWTQVVDHRKPELSYSNFDLRHRVVSQLGYTLRENERNKSYVTLVFTTQSGSPYTYVYAGDLNKDGSSRNDLVFVPESQDQIKLTDFTTNGVTVTAQQQWEQLDAQIRGDKYLNSRRGKYAERNGGRTPWNTQCDIRFAHEIGYSKKDKNRVITFTADIINFTNLLNHKWGWQSFVANDVNASYQLLDFKAIAADGTPSFQFKNPGKEAYQVDQLSSRWQAQLGVRLSF